jgi:hypothetical protein
MRDILSAWLDVQTVPHIRDEFHIFIALCTPFIFTFESLFKYYILLFTSLNCYAVPKTKIKDEHNYYPSRQLHWGTVCPSIDWRISDCGESSRSVGGWKSSSLFRLVLEQRSD